MEYTQDIPDQLFDTFTPDAEEQALRELASQGRVRHIIAGDRFVGRFSDGTRIILPLRLSVRQFRTVTGLDTASDGVDQFTTLVTGLAGQAEAEKIENEPLAEVAALVAGAYPRALQKVTELSMGESTAS